jgi:exopolysaccharide biosynthesis predicted pyruvyltransferase EpsI
MNINQDRCFDNLESDLRLLSEIGKLIYIANPGNWGDALIAEGTRKFFKERNLNVKEVDFITARSWGPKRLRWETKTSKPIMIYGGGGAFLDIYQRKGQVESVFGRFHRSLIMPSTYAVHLNTESAKKPVIMYNRDNYQSTEFCPAGKFCHDMAFNLSAPDVDICNSDGFLFREDAETPENILFPKNNRDLSKEGSAAKSIDDFFRVVGSFERIYTNRLHVAIAACLLNREVHLFPNSYFKNEAIYKSSIQPFFKNASFHNTTPEDYGLLC